MKDQTKKNLATVLTTVGRDPEGSQGMVNPPIYRASTIVFNNMDDLRERHGNKLKLGYGTQGTPTTFYLADAISESYGGGYTTITSSGLSSLTACLQAFSKRGSHLLIPDGVYGPARRFCEEVLARFGVSTSVYNSRIGKEIEGIIRDNTTLILLEAPASLTYEIPDIEAITEVARRRGVPTVFDNTWASAVYFNPLDHGADATFQALTKYACGTQDILLGAISTKNKDLFIRIREELDRIGDTACPLLSYDVLKGMRSMHVRIKHHYESALEIAGWLESRPDVAAVLYPPLPSSTDHARWKQYFKGGNGLLSFILDTKDDAAVDRMIDGLELFDLGASWGGYPSLVYVAIKHYMNRSLKQNFDLDKQTLIRLHIGLEDIQDLKQDLEAGFERLKQ